MGRRAASTSVSVLDQAAAEPETKTLEEPVLTPAEEASQADSAVPAQADPVTEVQALVALQIAQGAAAEVSKVASGLEAFMEMDAKRNAEIQKKLKDLDVYCTAVVAATKDVRGSLDAALARIEANHSEEEWQNTGIPCKLTDLMIDSLKAPLPIESLSPNPDNPKLSVIKPIYMIERLNDVFGVAGWTYTAEIVESAEQIVVKVKVSIPKYGIERESYGGNTNRDRGDAYKGAVTDALSKISSTLYIGMDVYKGFGPTKENGNRPQPLRTAVAELTQPSVAISGTQSTSALACDDCHQEIKTVTVGGQPYGPAELAANSQKNWEKNLCGDCQRTRRLQEKERKGSNGHAAASPAQVPDGPAPIR